MLLRRSDFEVAESPCERAEAFRVLVPANQSAATNAVNSASVSFVLDDRTTCVIVSIGRGPTSIDSNHVRDVKVTPGR